MKTTIKTSYSHGMYKLSFRKDFDLPFAPYLGMTIVDSWDDGEGDTEVELINDSGINTKIYYQAKENYFYINYRRYFRHPLTESDIDDLLESFSKSGWERYDTTDIAKLKDIMAKLAD